MLLLLFVVFSVILFVYKYRKSEQYEFPPGPKGLPIIGNLHQYSYSNTHSYLSKLGKTYGSIFMIRLMNKSMVVIQSAKLAKEVLRTQDKNFCNRYITTGRKKLSYNGLDIAFSPHSDYTMEMKKIISAYLFNSKKIESYSHIRKEEVSTLIEKVSSFASSSQVVNLTDLLVSYASSVSGRITFGMRYDDEVVSGKGYYSLAQEVEEMFTAFFFSDFIPVVGSWLDMFTGRSSKLDKVFKELDGIYEKIINDHLSSKKFNSEHEGIVEIMVRHMNNDSFGFKLTINHIKAVLMNLFVGRVHATAVLAIWAIVELIRNPTAMEKVQEELRNVAQNKDSIQESDLLKLKYLKAVIKETLRLHPPAPLLVPREAVHKSTLNGYTILPNTAILINAWTVGRDPKYWKDPEIFMPERYVDIEYKANNDGLFPFGGGRRMCPAYSIALANLDIVLANLLYAFQWELPTGFKKEDIDNNELPGLITLKKDQLYLIAKKFK